MKMIQISGLGVAGSYLFRRLRDSGFGVEACDPKRAGYYLPCGYATNEKLLDAYLRNIGMGAEDYVLSRAKSVTFSGNNFGEISFNSKGLCTIDKARLESDMIGEYKATKPFSPESADIRVDATGISRALLGKHSGDYTMYAKEYLTAEATHHDFYFYFFRKGHGYFWEFPLGDKYHVGAGSDSLEMIDERLSAYHSEVVTGRRIRLAPLFDNVGTGNVIGIGEAVGTVSPISGEGIMPSIKSAELLFQSIRRYSDVETIREEYRVELEKEFGYYSRLRRLVSRIQKGEKLGISDLAAARAAKRDLEMFGVDFRISKVIGHFL